MANGMIYGYARTSRKDLVLDNQRLQLQEQGVPPENIYADEGVSGATPALSRKSFADLNVKLQAGDTIIVAAFDRLSRRRTDLQAIFADWCVRRIRLRSLASTEAGLSRLMDTDPDDIAGAFVRDTVVSLLGFFGEMELESIRPEDHRGPGAGQGRRETVGQT